MGKDVSRTVLEGTGQYEGTRKMDWVLALAQISMFVLLYNRTEQYETKQQWISATVSTESSCQVCGISMFQTI